MSMLAFATDPELPALRERALHPPVESEREQELDAYVKAARREAALSVLRAWAWWREGTQYVGSCGTTLRVAEDALEKELAKARP